LVKSAVLTNRSGSEIRWILNVQCHHVDHAFTECSMKIRRIWLKDVGSFKELDIEIPAGTRPDRADVVVITGPNGSGKTTLLYALATVLGTVDQLGRRWGGTSEIAVDISVDEHPPLDHRFVLGTGQGFEQALARWVEPPDEVPVGTENLWHEPGYTLPPITDRFFEVSYSTPKRWTKGENEEEFPSSFNFLTYDSFRRIDSTNQLAIGDGAPYDPEKGRRFDTSIEVGAFETWIANTRTKIALAREDDDLEALRRYEKTVQTVEGAITDLTGETFSLKVSREPLEVLGVFNGASAPLSMLPDGLRSALAWLGDVLRRLDLMERPEGSDPLQTPIIVLLDEIDAHLHPEWQRKILYVAERLLPNAQLIVSTHSPFVVQSATDACIIKLGAHGESAEVVGPQSGSTFDAVLEDILGVRGDSFSVEIEAQLDTFKQQRNEVLQGKLPYEVLEARANELAALSESLDLSLQRHLVDVKVRIGAA
jgi:energy-coupling factor transporter ATP-binding protein EcfA2